MTPLLTTGLLGGKNSIKDSGLPVSFQQKELLNGDDTAIAGFADLLQQMTATDGNNMPFDLAALGEIDPTLLQQLGEQYRLQPDALSSSPISLLESIAEWIQANNDLVQHNPVLSDLASRVQDLLDQYNARVPGNIERNGQDNAVIDYLRRQQDMSGKLIADGTDTAQKNIAKTEDIPVVDSELLKQMSAFKLSGQGQEQQLLNDLPGKEAGASRSFEPVSLIDRSSNHVLNPASLTPTNLRAESTNTHLPRIDIPVNQPQWGQAVGERLMLMVNNKVQAANIILNPPELGPIEVRVNLNQDQASVHFVSNHAAVRDAIEDAFPRLRDMFAQNGLSLTDANVSQQSSSQEQQFVNDQNTGRLVGDAADIEHETTEDTNIIYQSRNIGLVDQYV